MTEIKGTEAGYCANHWSEKEQRILVQVLLKNSIRHNVTMFALRPSYTGV
jgi:hypothetical protein